MFNLPTYLARLWRYIKSSIAFIPGLYVLGFTVFFFILSYFEARGLSESLSKFKFGAFWLIKSADTARVILSTIIGGVVSLTVFSFSMVMVVLSQATSTLSPRLLPQLIRERAHQTVLGVYLGVIVMSYLALINIDPAKDWAISAFTIFVCVVLAIFCLALFVYFIASISERIQIGPVIMQVRTRARKDIEYWKSSPKNWFVANDFPTDIDEWTIVEASKSGYVDLPLYDRLSSLATEYDTLIYLRAPRAAYVLEGTPLLYVNRNLTKEERTKIGKAAQLSKEHLPELWHVLSIRHITEVAAKAMSPGINDPGSAIEAIDMITDIMSGLLEIPSFNLYKGKKGGPVFFENLEFSDILRVAMQSLRTYSKSDPVVMTRLALSLFKLRQKANLDKETYQSIDQEIQSLLEDGLSNLENSQDRKAFRLLILQHEARKEPINH